MSLPQAGANGVFVQVYPVADLSLSSVLSSSVTDTASVAFSTGCPASVVSICSLASGSGTLKVDRHATSTVSSFSSPDNSLTLSGTSDLVTVLDTTEAELYVSFQEVAGAGGMQFTNFAILVCYKLGTGEDWFNVRNAITAVMNKTLGDGSGVVALAVA